MLDVSSPPHIGDAVVLHVLSYPFGYFQLSDSKIRKLLVENGDFLVNVKEKILIVLKTNDLIHEFVISYKYDQTNGFTFNVSGSDFNSLFDVVSYLVDVKVQIPNQDDICHFIQPIRKKHRFGFFGFGRSVQTVKGSKKHLHFATILRQEFAFSENIEQKLEDLTTLKHPHLVQLKDFFVFQMGGMPMIITLQDQMDTSLDAQLPVRDQPRKTKIYVKWIYQIISALCYLHNNGWHCKCLTLRSCLLDKSGILKLTDIWPADLESSKIWQPTKNSNVLHPEFMSRNDYWRFVPPEILSGQKWSSGSQSWVFGCIAHQIFTHGLLPFRHQYSTAGDFLAGGGKDEGIFFECNVKDIKSLSDHARENYKLFQTCLKQNKFPDCPSALSDLFIKLLNDDLENRPTLQEALLICEKEAFVHQLSNILGKLIF